MSLEPSLPSDATAREAEIAVQTLRGAARATVRVEPDGSPA